jgi:outer membrane protein OmpA-like peptidoglycan-associated protein
MEALLEELYYDPETGFISANALHKKAKEIRPAITLKQVKDWYKTKLDIQQHAEKKGSYEDFRIASNNPNSWQMDLAFWEGKSILTAININSRLGFAKLLRNKGADSVLKGIKELVEAYKVDILTTDNGKEFLNRKATTYLKSKDITHYNNEPGDHATMGKIERFNRTIKMRLIRMRQPITENLVKSVINNYNDTYHTSIKSTPNQAKGQVMTDDLTHNRDVMERVENEISVGSTVLYRLDKGTFDKEKARWSTTIYEIVGLDGYRVQIRSKNGQTLYKSPNDIKLFNANPTDAQPAKNQVFEAEKILDHKKMRSGKYKYLVKWVGHGDSTWEPQDNLRLINKSKRSTLEVEYWK